MVAISLYAVSKPLLNRNSNKCMQGYARVSLV